MNAAAASDPMPPPTRWALMSLLITVTTLHTGVDGRHCCGCIHHEAASNSGRVPVMNHRAGD
jgi:hypothetical protein